MLRLASKLQQRPDIPSGSVRLNSAAVLLDTCVHVWCGLQALDIQGAVPSGSHPRQLAGQLLALMGAFTRDIATVHNILDSFYEYLDEKHRWQERGIVKVGGLFGGGWVGAVGRV
jgi:hypothetical protein